MATAESRRLAAVMFTDIVGYTALTQLNEARALVLLDRHNEWLRPIFPRFRGREIKTIGDSFLVEFADPLDATSCAVEVQRYLREINGAQSPENRVRVRIGLHLGMVHARGDDILGDVVNIASRIEPLAEPEGICVTDAVFQQVHSGIPYPFEKLEPKALKNVRYPPTVYRLVLPWSAPKPALTSRSARNRIAVLPFANLSPLSEDSYFADGMTEELIGVLAEVPGLQVIARTSVDQYKERKRPIREIGTELHVDSILEGSVRRAGDTLRIAVQLIQTDTEAQLWSARYDRALEDVFEIQTEVAKTVAESLRTRLRADVGAEVPSPVPVASESYLEYLKGRSLLRGVTEAPLREAKARFERAIALDERNARAYVELSRVTVWLNYFPSGSTEPWAELMRTSRTLVERALALDPGLAEAHSVLGTHLLAEYRCAEAEKELAMAVSLNPSYAVGHAAYGQLLEAQGRLEDALREYNLGEEADPQTLQLPYEQAVLLMTLGRLDEARAKLQKLAEVDQEGSVYHSGACLYALVTRDLPAALRHLELAEKDASPWGGALTLVLRAQYHALAGERAQAEAVLGQLKALPASVAVRADAVAQVCAYLGEMDECFRWLNQAMEDRTLHFFNWRSDPTLVRVIHDPRFRDLLKRANLE